MSAPGDRPSLAFLVDEEGVPEFAAAAPSSRCGLIPDFRPGTGEDPRPFSWSSGAVRFLTGAVGWERLMWFACYIAALSILCARRGLLQGPTEVDPSRSARF